MTHSSPRALLGLAAALCLGTFGPAQTGLGFTLKPSPSWIIISSASSVPGADIRQVFHVKLSNNFPGEWTTALVVNDLPNLAISCAGVVSTIGGTGSSVGVVIGKFDPAFGTFCVTDEAAALNSASDERHINLSPDGLWAIFERPTGVFLSSRAAVGTQFGAPVQVTGFTAGNRYYPALGPIGGVMNVFYTDGTNIVRQPIDLGAAALTGSPVIVSNPAQAGAMPISPTPIIGADGDVEMLWMADEVSPRTQPFVGDSDPVIASDLDPSTPAVVQVNRTDYQCCGSFAGGYVYFSHDISPAWHLMHSEAAILVGDDEVVGGTADLQASGVNPNAPSALIATYFLSVGVAPPFTLFGIGGALGLDPSVLLQIGQSATTSADGTSSLSFPIPNNGALAGASLALQAVLTNSSTLSNTLSNTAWLHIR